LLIVQFFLAKHVISVQFRGLFQKTVSPKHFFML
jgi:hypothetical protein